LTDLLDKQLHMFLNDHTQTGVQETIYQRFPYACLV